MSDASVERHNVEIAENKKRWENKPLLQKIYRNFHTLIAQQLSSVHGTVCELGSGVGNIRDVIPHCLRTDIFPNPWVDQVENAYALSFQKATVSSLILFDVFHHLRFPATALKEFHRVLAPGGRVILFEPCVSLLGRLIYGVFHHEPLLLGAEITWEAPQDWRPDRIDYYAAQGNAFRIFCLGEQHPILSNYTCIHVQRFSALPYVASGGYSKPQLYPDWAYPLLRGIDRWANLLPTVVATRLLVTLEKKRP